MTQDALAFIREDMQREETRTVDLHALVDSVAADLAELGHDIAVADSERVLVACRAVALRRALRNLLENAAAYGGRAAARIERDGEEICIVIDDEGPGIPEAKLERVFEALRAARGVAQPRHRGQRPRGSRSRAASCAATAETFRLRTAPTAD